MTAAGPRLSSRFDAIPVPATVAMTARARAMRAAGREVISLSIGEPDFPTPPHAVAAADAAARAGDTHYPPQDGTAALKAAVIRKFARENGLVVAPDEVTIGNGSKQILFNALMATIDPGDEVVIPAPYWVSYLQMTRLAGGEPVPVVCREEDGFRLRPEVLDAAIGPRTRCLLLNFPNNPTGAACSADELAALGAVLLRHPHVWVLSDDVYEHLRYDGAPPATLAAVVPALRDRVITCNSVSKSYAMTGWRVGYAAGPRAAVRAMANMQGQATAGVSTVGQAAAAAVLDGPQHLLAERAAIYRERRDVVVAALNAVPGLRCARPDGAFYVFPHIGGCLGRRSGGGRALETDTDFAEALLEETGVAVVQGAAFGLSPHIRISYATETALLTEACGRIAAFCRAAG